MSLGYVCINSMLYTPYQLPTYSPPVKNQRRLPVRLFFYTLLTVI